MDSDPILGGYNDGIVGRYSMQPQNVNLTRSFHCDGSLYPEQNQFLSSSQHTQLPRSETPLPLCPSQSTSGFQSTSLFNSTYREAENFFTEEEIRLKSHEMLENEDMQQLLHVFNMGDQSHDSFHAADGYPYSSPYISGFSISYPFNDELNRSNGKAVVGWLKIKAALR